MECRLPTLEDREALRDYLRECRDNNEQNVLLHQELFEEGYPAWVGPIARNSREGNGDRGRSLLLLCSDGDEAVGILCIRYELSVSRLSAPIPASADTEEAISSNLVTPTINSEVRG